MGNVVISEYTNKQVSHDKAGLVVQTVTEPPLVSTKIAYTTATTHTYNTKTVFVRLSTDAYLEYLNGTSTVDANSTQAPSLPASGVEHFKISDTTTDVSLYDGSS